MQLKEANWGVYEVVADKNTGEARLIQYSCDLKQGVEPSEVRIPDEITIKPAPQPLPVIEPSREGEGNNLID